MQRRKFLNGLAAIGGLRAVPSAAVRWVSGPEHAVAGQRQRPAKGIFLRSSTLAVTFDATDGLPYTFGFGGEVLAGEDSGAPATAILCRLAPRAYVTVPLKVAAVRRWAGRVDFVFEVPWEAQPAARFSLRYVPQGASLMVTVEDVVEHAGFELIEVALPNLVTVREGDPDGWMAQGRDCGSFVRVAAAKPYRYPDDQFFGRISTQLPVGIVGHGKVGCLMEVSGFMDATETAVVEREGRRSAQIGTVQVHRVHGGRCYDMNDGGPAVCGNDATPNLLVGQTPRCRLDFFAVEDAASPWFPAVKLLRDRMPLSPTNYYDDKLLYLVAGKSKTEPKPRTTFTQSRELIRDVARLTDFALQVVLLSGWVYDGQDTGYPSDDVVNTSLGSYAELMQLMEDGRKLNANVTVNENYDDAYKSSPEFSLDFIAREPNGAVWKSRAWDVEDSYIVGMAKYVRGGWARRRIAATMARYKLRDAMLIDALSWFAIRNDWDPAHPASGYKNLVDGKWAVLEEFHRRGVHIASEQFRYPMLGKLALSVDGPSPRRCPFGGEPVPLTAMVYRKAAIFGGASGGGVRPQESLFGNSRPGLWFRHATDRREITDFYYLIALPYGKVHRLDAVGYEAAGTVRTIRLEGGSAVVMDAAGKGYRVVLAGKTIAQDGATMCPVDATKIAFYAREGGRLSYPLPTGWVASAITARSLTVEGRKEFPVTVEAGNLVVEVPAQVPVMVYASPDAVSTSQT